MELHAKGMSLKNIGDKTGVPKATVWKVVNRHTDRNAPKKREKLTRAPATTPEAVKPVETHMETVRNGMDPYLTQENTAAEIVEYVKFFKHRTKCLPYPDLSDHDKVWAETNYGKRWAEGIHMMVDATGLSAEALISAVDDFEIDVVDALKRFNAANGEG
jgi:hypothetical protein